MKAYSFPFFLLLAYTLLMVIPISFQATGPYVDSAWAYDLNYFLHSRYHFGPDLVFTYGPLGFLNNPQNVGRDIAIALVIHLAFWVVLGVQLTSIWSSGRRKAAVAICISLLLAHRLYYDYWDYFILALGLITIVKLFRTYPDRTDFILVPVLSAISFLVKFTAFYVIICMLGAYTLHLIFERSLSRRRASWLVLCFMAGPIAYLAYNFSFTHLVEYSVGSLQLATGFATAMSWPSTPKDRLLAYLAAGILLSNLVAGLWRRRFVWTELLLFGLVAWIVFRHGFVRADSGHPPLFFGFTMLVFACLFMGWPGMPGRPEWLLTISSLVFAAVALVGLSARYPVLAASNWWPKQGLQDLRLLNHPKELEHGLDHGSDSAFAALPGMAFRRQVEHKLVMAFPNGTPYAAKLDLTMFPFFTLQDYAAYTSFLDKNAAESLVNANPRVDKIIFEWGVFDGLNPVVDTPATTMSMLANFTFESRAPGAVLLRHREVPLPLQVSAIGRADYQGEQWVEVPRRNELVAFSIDLHQNFWGNLVTFLYEQKPIFLDVETGSGVIRHFRVPPQNLANPGIINFVPNSIDDVERLWKCEPLPDRVTRFRLTGSGLRHVVSSGFDFYSVQNAGVTFLN